MVSDEITTALVVARPTPSAPPSGRKTLIAADRRHNHSEKNGL